MKSWRYRLCYAAGWLFGAVVALGLALLFAECAIALLDGGRGMVR